VINKKIILIGILLSFLLVLPSFSEDLSSVASAKGDLSLQDIIQNIQSNQSQIKDLYAETTTTITSNMALPGAKDKGPQAMVQKGRMWTKGRDKSKIEIISPTRQTTITNGDKITIINPDSGQTFTQDLSKMREQAGIPKGGSMDLSKALDSFYMSIEQREDQYVLIGKPKQPNKFLGKMEFYIDVNRWLPVKILIYTPTDKIMNITEMDYKEISGIWITVETSSTAITPMGAIKTQMVLENIKINQGISDSEFK